MARSSLAAIARSAHARDWTRQPSPKVSGRNCYTRKADALNVFKEHNVHVLDPTGGMNAKDSTGVEFEAINHRYDLTGNARVTTWAEALWVAMPTGKPYCLDRLDLKTLNQLPQVERHGGFRLPDFARDEAADDTGFDEFYRGRGRELTPQRARFQEVALECHDELRQGRLPERGDFAECMRKGLKR